MIRAYDMTTQMPISQAGLPRDTAVMHLVRWGSDGLAMSASAYGGPVVMIIRGAMVDAP